MIQLYRPDFCHKLYSNCYLMILLWGSGVYNENSLQNQEIFLITKMPLAFCEININGTIKYDDCDVEICCLF